MEKVKKVLRQCLESEVISPRQLAALAAGKLISMAYAVLPASLYSKTLFEAIQGKITVGRDFPNVG
jgi:hypothetical protein